MASSFLSLRRAVASVKRAPTRRFSTLPQLQQTLQNVSDFFLTPNLVTLETSFSAPDNLQIHNSCSHGTGVFLDSKLIVTSAQVVGRLSTFYEPKMVGKSEQFEHGSILHNSYIGNTVALTGDGKYLGTRPLAVYFGCDVAVLEVVDPDWALLCHRTAANSWPDKGNILVGGRRRKHQSQLVITLEKVRAVGVRTIGAKPPWPLDDGLGWIEHGGWGWVEHNGLEWIEHDSSGGGGPPPPSSILSNCRERVTGSISKTSGSPWFNLKGEVAGIASWDVRDEPSEFSVGFAVPTYCIKGMVNYAKTKGPKDPIVVDHWINNARWSES